MTPEQFVKLAKNERDQFLGMCFDSESGSRIAAQIAAMQLEPGRVVAMKQVIGGLLTDVFYSWLLALDGCASFGGQQRDYVLRDEDGSLLTDYGGVARLAECKNLGGTVCTHPCWPFSRRDRLICPLDFEPFCGNVALQRVVNS